MRSNRVVIGVSVVLAMIASSCSSTTSTPGVHAPSTGRPGTLLVVAAENFYGDIVDQLGGREVSVTSILTDPNADPHLFEPGTANAAAVSDASLVIVNGLGYDSFMQRLLDASPNPDRVIVTVADALGISGTDANPHIWYDVPRQPDIARAIEQGLIAADPAHANSFRSNLKSFDDSLGPLTRAVAAIRSSHAGAPVAYTEPVPGYLLQAAGLIVRTPEDFARAIEEGNDPTPQAVAAMEALVTTHQIDVLLYNSQATSPITERLQGLAAANAIPIVPVTETLPPNMSFQQWQLAQIQALAKALGS